MIAAKWNIPKAASLLGITKVSLYWRLRNNPILEKCMFHDQAEFITDAFDVMKRNVLNGDVPAKDINAILSKMKYRNLVGYDVPQEESNEENVGTIVNITKNIIQSNPNE